VKAVLSVEHDDQRNDFNNLLTVIEGNAKVLKELPSHADEAYRPQLLSAVARADRRGAELTQKLLSFARAGPALLACSASALPEPAVSRQARRPASG
jgi:signal transduction histidine kinase